MTTLPSRVRRHTSCCRGLAATASGVAISHDSLSTSDRSTARAGSGDGSSSNSCSSVASQNATVAMARLFPGQLRRPAPNGASLRSDPIIGNSAADPMATNLSGRNSAGSAHTSGSCVMAHMFTMAVVPAGMRWPSTWTSDVARRAHDSSGPGGWSLTTSLITACRYTSDAEADSVTARPAPTTRSSSSWTRACTSGCSTRRASTHSITTATVSVPRNTISCKRSRVVRNGKQDGDHVGVGEPVVAFEGEEDVGEVADGGWSGGAEVAVPAGGAVLVDDGADEAIDAGDEAVAACPGALQVEAGEPGEVVGPVELSQQVVAFVDEGPQLAGLGALLGRVQLQVVPPPEHRPHDVVQGPSPEHAADLDVAATGGHAVPDGGGHLARDHGALRGGGGDLPRREEYVPWGANPMARWNRSPYADSLMGRSANAALLRISLATSGCAATTIRVSPTENAMSRRARGGRRPAAAASLRCARPVMSHMLPITGRPLGPAGTGDESQPRRVQRHLPHAGPPGKHQWRRQVTKQAAAQTARKPARRNGWRG
nr:unnamed protein product [Digitaria exilis]